MELTSYIPLLISLFFILGWTLGILISSEFQILSNIYTVIWWWLGLIVLIMDGSSFWYLLLIMPLVLILSLFTTLAFGPLVGFFLTGVPVIFFYFM